MTFRVDDGDKDKFNHSLHHPSPLKFDQSLHYIAPLRTPILPEQKYYKTKHLECNSLYFNGTNSYIDCGSNPTLNPLTDLTINITLCPSFDISTVGGGAGDRVGWYQNNKNLWCMFRDGKQNYMLRDAAGNYQNISGNKISWNTNECYMLTLLYSAGNGYDLYVNKNSDGSGADFGALLGGGVNITIGYYNKYFNGYINKIRLYNRIITTTEILRLYQNKDISPTGLVLDLPITSDYNSKKIIKDESGNDNDGTLHDCTWNCDWIREKHKVI